MRSKVFFKTASTVALVSILIGCGSTAQKPPEVLSFNGNSGVIKVEGWRTSGQFDRPTIAANDYCLKIQGGYGIKDIASIGGGQYAFSCFVKTIQQAKPLPQTTAPGNSAARTPEASSSRCSRFGFINGTSEHSNCILQLELAEKKSLEDQERFAAEKAAYDRKVLEIEKESERRKSLRQIELGLRLLGGQNPVDAVNSVGTGAPIAPRPPGPVTHNINLPNGGFVSCTTVGRVTDCY